MNPLAEIVNKKVVSTEWRLAALGDGDEFTTVMFTLEDGTTVDFMGTTDGNVRIEVKKPEKKVDGGERGA